MSEDFKDRLEFMLSCFMYVCGVLFLLEWGTKAIFYMVDNGIID